MTITLQLTLDDKKVDEMLTGIFENFPEASGGMTMACLGWDHKNFRFLFEDEETGKRYHLTKTMALKGLEAYLNKVIRGEGCNTTTTIDPGDWDAWDYDAVVQLAIFGEIRYG